MKALVKHPGRLYLWYFTICILFVCSASYKGLFQKYVNSQFRSASHTGHIIHNHNTLKFPIEAISFEEVPLYSTIRSTLSKNKHYTKSFLTTPLLNGSTDLTKNFAHYFLLQPFYSKNIYLLYCVLLI